jgi:hypothetical protein
MTEEYTPVPVMGTLVVNGVNLLRRLLASVDYPVKEFVIFNNNGRGQIDAELDELVKEPHEFIQKMRVVHMPCNVGCPAGWNLIIKCYMMEPFWFIVSHDIEFGPGLIKEMMDKTLSQPGVGMVHIAVSDRLYGSYEAFIIKDWVIQHYGLFDENLYPAYVEDVEYIIRTNGIYWDYGTLPYKHEGRTVEVEPELKEKIDAARLLNEWEYMFRRWGDDEWWITYKADGSKHPHIPWDLGFVRRKYIGF